MVRRIRATLRLVSAYKVASASRSAPVGELDNLPIPSSGGVKRPDLVSLAVYMVLVKRISGTLAFLKPGAPAPASTTAPVMPFIDDDLLWPDNDTDSKIPDLSQCLANESSGSLGELSTNDLTGLDTHLDDETEDIFNQLADPSFELEQFFDFEEKEENNNSVGSIASKNPVTVALLQEIHRNSLKVSKLNIAAANPLLAEKLATPASVVPGSPTASGEAAVFPTPLRQIKTEPDTSRTGEA